VPVGLAKHPDLKVEGPDLEAVLERGAERLVELGWGTAEDLDHIEERGCYALADARAVSDRARERGKGQLGTLGSGNHFVEVQRVDAILEPAAAEVFGLREGQLVVLVHTGSRGLGHQVCTDAVHVFQKAMKTYGLEVPDRQLACAPVRSPEGKRYLGAMAAAANFAWANRQAITQRVRESLRAVFGEATAKVVYDVAHNIAKLEEHTVDGRRRNVCVHRKGATRAFAAGRPELPEDYRATGQPVFIPGSMGTASYVLVGTERAMTETFGSVCHGAGRALSRSAAKRAVNADEVLKALKERGISIRAGSKAGIVEEFPGAYKDVHDVIHVVEGAGLARAVARLVPLGVVKG
jgi:tRNA-splicing ligase RtcB